LETKKYVANDYFRPNELFHINYIKEATSKDVGNYHSHDFVEICYVATGSGHHIVDGQDYPVRKGDLFIINYDMRHIFYQDESSDALKVFNVVFKPAFFDHLLINFNDFNTLTLSYLFKIEGLEEWNFAGSDLRLDADEQRALQTIFENMLREYNAQLPGYNNVLRGNMIELIVKIMRNLKNRSLSTPEVNEKAKKIDSIVQYLKENYAGHITLSDLAFNTFFSKNYICKIFKETTGMTIKEYVHILQIEDACHLIANTTDKLTEIALKVGFTDYKNFFSVFKKIKSISPQDFKKNAHH